MKKSTFFASLLLPCLLLVSSQVFSQPGSACPGWHNPTSFVTGNPQYFFSGKVIDRCNSVKSSSSHDVGMGPQYYTSRPVVNATMLSSSVASGCYGITLADGSNRFVIKGTGTDPNTGNNISFLPPYNDHEGRPYSHSIRVGTECTEGAEVLYYQMRVMPQNTLLTLWYAPVVQTPSGHDQYENSALIIRVSVLRNGQWELADSRFEYIVSGQPANSGYPQGLVDGVNGWHYRYVDGYADIWYKDWTKAMISLSEYINYDVRIEIYMSACVYDAHYAYCYIAGDFQPMEVSSSGCPAGVSTVVDTLKAPTDMMQYTWYKTTTAVDLAGSVLSVRYLDSLPDGTIRTQRNTSTGTEIINWVRVSPFNGENKYLVQSDDFRPVEGPNTGVIQGHQSFMCKMISYIDPAKPFESYVFQPVANNKPQLNLDTVLSCDGSVKLINQSMSPNMGLDAEMTKWYVYNNPSASGTPLQVLTGDTAVFHADQAGQYYVNLWACTQGDSTCNTEGVFNIRAVKNPENVNIGVIPSDEPCIGDEVVIVDSTFLGPNADERYSRWSRIWSFDGTTVRGNEANPNESVTHAFFEEDTVSLITRNGLFYMNRNNTRDTVWCADTASRVIKVFSSPELSVSDDTIVCKGNQTKVKVSADIEGDLTYEWYESLNATGTPICTGTTLMVTPPNNIERKTYYVKVTRMPQGCVAWDSITVRVIKPTIHQSVEKICQGDSVFLWGEDAHHYSWAAAPGDISLGGQDTNQRIHVAPKVSTVYTMVGHGSDNCSAAPLTASVTVIPFPVPQVKLSPSFIDSEDPTVTFTDISSGSVSSSWVFGLDPATGKEVSYTFGDLNQDSVMVQLKSANTLGCSSDTTFFVPIQRFSAWFPNAFTPNKTDNSVFSLKTVNELEFFSIYIYDRRGAQVFASHDQNFVWDGTVNGLRCPQGVYVYICRYRRPGTDDITVKKGTITILR